MSVKTRVRKAEAQMNVRTYHGSGSLRYVENQIDCTFTLAQSSDGDVRLECTTPPGMSPPAHWMAGLFGPMPVPEMFEGRLAGRAAGEIRGGFRVPGGWSHAEGAKAFFELNGPGAEAVVGAVAGAGRRRRMALRDHEPATRQRSVERRGRIARGRLDNRQIERTCARLDD